MASIYLVQDMINDLIHPDGPNGKQGSGPEAARRNVVPNTAKALEKARKAGIKVGFVRVGFSPDYKECPPNSPVFSRARENGIFQLGTWGTEVHADLKPRDDEFDIVKHRVSPFYGTSLEPVLRANGITRIYCSGVSTNGVVHACVREGHDRDYEIVVLEDCCSAGSPEEHDMSLKVFTRFCKEITTADQVQFS
ncbi:MAG: isochorismatase family cysteine hydrolase [Acetobacterales bacterium]